jgi:hypothetical protein
MLREAHQPLVKFGVPAAKGGQFMRGSEALRLKGQLVLVTELGHDCRQRRVAPLHSLGERLIGADGLVKSIH